MKESENKKILEKVDQDWKPLKMLRAPEGVCGKIHKYVVTVSFIVYTEFKVI